MSLIDPGADWAGAYELEKRWREVEQEEKRELELEIERHHRDFQKIRDILDKVESAWDPPKGGPTARLIQQIRNVVG